MSQASLDLNPPLSGIGCAISPMLEMGAYEALWMEDGATQKRIADRFRKHPDAMPSDLVDSDEALRMAERVLELHRSRGLQRFGVRVHRAGDYPERLRDARHPVEVLQYKGIWELSETPSVAIVGARKASEEGLRRARKLAALLVRAQFTVVSGLAAGIDRAAHETAIGMNAPTIAVIGTPLSTAYPPENAELQGEIARNHLLISEVPVARYYAQDWRTNRSWFPARNATMSAMTRATVIVEASDTSGTLIQARAALHQGRKLFILNSCFERRDLTWPARFEKQGAIRVRKLDDVLKHL